MRKALVCIALLSLAMPSAVADPRGPSTPEERKRALDVIEKLEQSPMDPALKRDREWVFQWIKEVPDVHANMCSAIVGPLLNEKNTDARKAFTLQNILASAAFRMQHPEDKDSVKIYLAGTQGMLRAYENVTRQDPTKKSPFLEQLKSKEQIGQLEDYVRRGARQCSKHPATTLAP
ncbi:MAG TPA: hypothetical protein VN622_11230 [Clostridia bacterium]|nr:hypothetical protein [Clostridia bacterium]